MVTNGFKLTINNEAEQVYVLESRAYAVRRTACVANAKTPLFLLLPLFFLQSTFVVLSLFTLSVTSFPRFLSFLKLFLTTHA